MIGRRSNCVPLCDLTNCAISSRVKKVDRKKIIYEPRKTIKWDIPIQGGQAQWNTGRDNDNLIEIYQENYGILGRSNNPRRNYTTSKCSSSGYRRTELFTLFELKYILLAWKWPRSTMRPKHTLRGEKSQCKEVEKRR